MFDSLQVHGLQHIRLPCSSPSSQSLPKLVSIESVMPSNYLILCHPLLLLPSVFPSIRVFSSELSLRIRWPTYWSFSFSISPSNEHPGLISFRMHWLDLLADLLCICLTCWRRLRVPWGARRSNQSILKEINPECSLEGLMLKLKLQYFGHLIPRTNSLGKTLILGKTEGRRRRGQERMRCLDGITDSMDVNLSQVWETVKVSEAWHAAIHGVAKIPLSNWTTTTNAWLFKSNQIYFEQVFKSLSISARGLLRTISDNIKGDYGSVWKI